jgi:ketol-acid reductoisomerase
MKEHLREIQTGSFAREWASEMANGYPVFNKLREESLKHPINDFEQTIRDLVRSST